MSSRFIVDSTGKKDGLPSKTAPKVKAIRPFGSTILVEMLNANEALATHLVVKAAADVGAPQAYVVAIGPRLDANCGIKVGDRVMLQGKYVPVPKLPGETRSRGIIELHEIKAIFEEEVEVSEEE